MKYILIIIFIAPFAISNEAKTEISIDEITSKYAEKASRAFVASKKNPVHMNDRIKDIEKAINSDSYLNRKRSYSNDLALKLGLDDSLASSHINTNKPVSLPEGHTPILFVSSSIPVQVLNTYASDLSRVGGVMIFRGTVGGISKLMPTLKLINKIRKKDLSCVPSNNSPCEKYDLTITIDPKRFILNEVNRVPALIFEKEYSSKTYCESGEPKSTKNIVYGDASLEGMILSLYSINDDKDLLKPLNILQGIK